MSGQSSGCFYLVSCHHQQLIPIVLVDTGTAWPKCTIRHSGTELEMPSQRVLQPISLDGSGCCPMPAVPAAHPQPVGLGRGSCSHHRPTLAGADFWSVLPSHVWLSPPYVISPTFSTLGGEGAPEDCLLHLQALHSPGWLSSSSAKGLHVHGVVIFSPSLILWGLRVWGVENCFRVVLLPLC